MPGLVVFNRRWHVGSDDLAFPATVEIIIRTAWIVSVSVILSLYPYDILPLGCSQSHMLVVYYFAVLALLLANILLNAAIAAISSHGAIMDETPRAHIPLCVYVKMALWTVELGVVCFGTYISFGVDGVEEECDTAVYWMIRVTAMAEWLMFMILILGFIITFDPLGRHAGRVEQGQAKQMWEGRCRMMCLGACNNKKENVFQSIAVIFTRFFGGVDLVLTDLAAGLLLLYEAPDTLPGPDTHADVLLTGRPSSRPITDSEGDRPSWMVVTAAAHYMKYALGSYGWLLYTYSHPCTGLCRLMPKCLCCGCMRGAGKSGDFCCQCEHAAILKQTGVSRGDIIFASFFNWVEEIPFFVCYDHEKQAVVLAIRGTLSLKDTLTDANAQREDVDVPGAGVQQVHQGIQAAAQYIYDTLRKHNVLYTAFRNTSNCADYQLVLCGHSLGAGAAALLAVMLRPEFPNLHCFAFSPPGWLVSAGLQKLTQEYVMAVVVGDDLVPRMGLLTLERLKVEILQALKYCHCPKHEVLLTGCHMICGSGRGIQAPPNTCAATGQHLAMIEAVVKDSDEFQASETPLFMPGRVLYIEPDDESSHRLYKCRWTSAREFDRIIISAQMVSDHMPDKVTDALQYCKNHASTQ